MSWENKLFDKIADKVIRRQRGPARWWEHSATRLASPPCSVLMKAGNNE